MSYGHTTQWLNDRLAREAARRDRGTPLQGPPITVVARESDLHDQVMNECKRRGWLWVHARMDKASHMSVGAPDFIILADNGRVLWVECKRRDGKLSTEQQAFKAWAEKLGHEVHVVRSLEEFVIVADWPKGRHI